MKRRWLCLLLVLFLLCGLLGCTAEDGSSSTTSTSVRTTGTTLPTQPPSIENVQADSIRYSKGTVNYQVAVIERDGKCGLIDFEGRIVLPIEYHTIELNETEYGAKTALLRAYKTEWGESVFLEADGSVSPIEPGGWGHNPRPHVYWDGEKPIVWTIFDGIAGSTYEDYVRYWHAEDNMLGTIAFTPPTVVPIRHMRGWRENEHEELEADLVSERYALFDFESGKLLTDFVYEDYSLLGMYEGVLAMKKNGRWGYVNEKGKPITRFEYDVAQIGTDGRGHKTRMYAVTNGYIVVRKGDKWGLIDKQGKAVLPIEYEDLSQVNDSGQLWTKQNGTWSLLDLSNQ